MAECHAAELRRRLPRLLLACWQGRGQRLDVICSRLLRAFRWRVHGLLGRLQVAGSCCTAGGNDSAGVELSSSTRWSWQALGAPSDMPEVACSLMALRGVRVEQRWSL